MPNKKKTAGIAVAAGALAIAAGVGVAGLAQAEPTPSPGAPSASPSTGQSTDPGRGGDRDGRHHRGGGFFGGDLAEELAEKLGVTEEQVSEALEASRDESRQDLAKALAEKLGVSEATVKTALDEIRAARQSERAAALKERLDAAVKDGTLTQAEADAVTKAVEKGVIGGGRR